MGLGKHKEQILAALRAGCRLPLRSENAAWHAIERIVPLVADSAGGVDRKTRVDHYIYELCLIYAYQTGAMPGFTNSESETRFERFAYSIPIPVELKLTRNHLKSCIRRIDAKRNPDFARDLENLSRSTAAE
jgi:hypothetical protein